MNKISKKKDVSHPFNLWQIIKQQYLSSLSIPASLAEVILAQNYCFLNSLQSTQISETTKAQNP